ncbi:MAG TPA: DNA polymerase [Verrucomicrobiae bacterium]|nr:DNA polymerase [Verrucomicrobiae bacterium]
MNDNEQVSRGELAQGSGSALADSAQGPVAGNGGGSSHFAIPTEINTWDRLQAAQFYHGVLGWAVHGLFAKDRGDEQARGKRPLAKGWKDHRAEEVTRDYLESHFGEGTNHNLGAVVRPPFVHVDLDSKPDKGESVRRWLSTMPELASTPRERTAGGAHLLFICRDLPKSILLAGRAPTSKINDQVNGELYKDGTNIVLSPSIHKSGVRYLWEVTGEIPEVKWADLRRWFGFQEPAQKQIGRHPKEAAWWAQFEGDLETLGIVAVCRELGILGEELGGEEPKWSVSCPWESEHSTRRGPRMKPGSDAVVFEGVDGQWPGFNCFHAHCEGRSLEQFLSWAEAQSPGIVDKHCRRQRVWSEGQCAEDGRARIVLPGLGLSVSDFARKMGDQVGPREVWFQRNGRVVTVEVERKSERFSTTVFHEVLPAEACSGVEAFVETGVLIQDKQTFQTQFVPKSMNRECAGMLLVARPFLGGLPEITRILDVPIPVREEGGSIVVPQPGYNRDFRLFVDPGAPIPVAMPIERAIGMLADLHASFPFKDPQSRVHALARIITPFCRGLMGWDARFPLWFYVANRPRAGKDYLGGLAFLLFEGSTCEDAPLGRESEETRKRITAAVMAGRRMMHLANCQFHIDDPHLTAAITTKVFAGRNIGSTAASADLRLPMEIEFSLSANIGLTFREDLGPRMRQIHLAFFEEDPNGRRFKEPDLHGLVLRERVRILGAIKALVDYWIAQGCPPGPTPFNSFPEWGRVVGGVMVCCGLGDPCLPHTDEESLGGDLKTKAMRAVFLLGFERRPNEWFAKGGLFDMVKAGDDEAFDFFGKWQEDDGRAARKRLGMALTEFKGRELSNIRLEMDRGGKGAAQKVRFRQVESTDGRPPMAHDSISGNLGNLGNLAPPSEDGGKKSDDRELEVDNNMGALRKRDGVSDVSGVSDRPSQGWRLVCARGELGSIASAICAAGCSVALDVETFGPGRRGGLDPWRGEIRLLSLSLPGREPWLIDLRAVGYDLGPLGEALAKTEVLGHNIKFDALWLRVKCGVTLPRCYCTLTAARLLTAGIREGNNLNQCLERYLKIQPGPDHSRADWGGMVLPREMLAYAARDVAHLAALRERIEAEIRSASLGTVAEIEMSIIPAVVAMEAAGMHVGRERLAVIATEAEKRAEDAARRLREILGRPGLNPASPEQLRAALIGVGIAVENTAEATLKEVDDGRIVPLILAMRADAKLAQQARGLLESVGADGRIHGRFDPMGTATGRFASHDPNMQNIPRGEMRRCFTAAPGRRLVVADYSQIELRAAAVIAGEDRMIEGFTRGDDLHRATAAVVLDKPIACVTAEDRQLAKAVNFGLVYGQSPGGLIRYAAASYGVALNEGQARHVRERFFRAYPTLRAWHDTSRARSRAGATEARTPLGRRRLIPAEASEWERFTTLVNTPVQGGCADGMKVALQAVSGGLPPSACIVGTVHDEIIVEAGEGDADGVRAMVETRMREAMQSVLPGVPIAVETKVVEHWGAK